MNVTSCFSAQAARNLCLSLFAVAALGACGGGDTKTDNATGQSSAISATISVSGSMSGNAPLNVTFSATDPKGPIASYEWNFKDNSPVATGQSVQHTFMEPGSYDITLTVRDSAGRFNSAAKMVTVTGQAIANPTAGAFWKDVNLASDAKVLNRAAVLFAGRNATAAEEAAVASGGMPVLRQTIRGYMQGPAFQAFLDETGETWFLTRSATILGNNMGYNATDWPSAANVINNMNLDATLNERNRFTTASRLEPIEMMKHVVNGDKPWTDMVAGNYTVVTALVAQYMQATVTGTFANPMDDTVFLPATLPNQRLGGNRDHAGVLSTQAWLAVNPTTPTNRNRHRVYIAAKQFLGTDVAALGRLPIDDSALTAFRIPTMENPGCAICHDTIDPIAAGWQNWQENNRDRPFKDASGKDHALPGSYRSGAYPKDANNMAYYKVGDGWFRDEKAPGYNGTAMPGGVTGSPTALSWLGQQMANDPRYSLGAAYFWWKAVSGQDPLTPPLSTSTPEDANRLSAFNAQFALFQDIANRFKTNRGNGAYNVKDLLVDLVTSPWARAESTAVALTAARQIELGGLGAFNMLNPVAVNRKLLALVGQTFADFNNPYAGNGLNYGDFDGINRPKRAQEHTMMQTAVLDRLVATRSCTFTQNDFNKTQATRLLFTKVNLTDTPATAAGQAAIKDNLVYLMKWMWKVDTTASDPEVQRAYQLFVDIWNDRGNASPQPVTCAYNNANDANYTGRTWSAVLGYFVEDKNFLFE